MTMSGDVANAIALLKKLTKVNSKKKHSKPFLPMSALQDCKVRTMLCFQILEHQITFAGSSQTLVEFANLL